METRRVILFAAFAWLAYSLWINWQQDYPPPAIPTSIIQEKQLIPEEKGTELMPHHIQNQSSSTSSDSSPPVSDSSSTDISTPNSATSKESNVGNSTSKFIQVKTDVLDLLIDSQQGNIIEAKLLAYPENLDKPDTPITILQNKTAQRYVANSSLFISEEQTIKNLNFNFSPEKLSYELQPGQNELIVSLPGEAGNGLKVEKQFIFTRDNYLIKVQYQIVNQSNTTWKGYMNTQLLRSSPPEDSSSIFHIGSYTGASYSNPGQKNYQKVPFTTMKKENLDKSVESGWVAMQQHYFLTAWIPPSKSRNLLYTRASKEDYSIGAVSDPIVLEPGAKQTVASQLYIGPEITSTLKAIAPGLDLTVDYGWLWWLSSLLFSLMKTIYSIVGNWGWVIVLVTVLIKLAFYRLSATSYKSMAGMRKIQPKLQALRERYGQDKAKLSQATMELYRQEKVNPLNGCLPIIIQIPVFIALYWVLLESVELRQAPFIFWIKDLSAPDPFRVLPVIMGLTMLIQQKLNPAPPDPMQAKIMMFLPVLFTALFWNFPAGLVLYWTVNNSLSILQQWYITEKYSKEDKVIKAPSKKALSKK